MITNVLLLILCFQEIHWIVCWDMKEPLILNKNGKELSFPNFVDKTDDNSSMVYKKADDENTSTFTFCEENFRSAAAPPTSDPTPDKYLFRSIHSLVGKLLEDDVNRKCQNEIRFERSVIQNSEKQITLCGNKSNPGYKMYKAHYWLIVEKDLFSHTLYEYCYNDEQKFGTLYAHYNLNNPSLLTNDHLIEEQNYQFELDEPTMWNPEELTYQYYGDKLNYKPHEVAISAFIPFANWRKTFYQLHNVAPMNSDLHEPWRIFVQNVKSMLALKTEHIKVYSGIYGVRRGAGNILYLSGTNAREKMKIPLAWWILLSNESKTQGVSLIMHNYAYDYSEKKPKPLCKKCQCAEAGLQDAIPKATDAKDDDYSQALIYCCPASTIAKRMYIYDDNPDNGNRLIFNDDQLMKFTESSTHT